MLKVRRKPESLNFVEAASMPYVGVVGLSILNNFLRLWDLDKVKGKR